MGRVVVMVMVGGAGWERQCVAGRDASEYRGFCGDDGLMMPGFV